MKPKVLWVSHTGTWVGPTNSLSLLLEHLEQRFDSTVLPIRVSYQLPQHEGIALSALQAAEYSWFTEVDDYGFLPPPIEPGVERYRMYIEDAGPTAAGYLSPYESNPDTSWGEFSALAVTNPAENIPDSTGLVPMNTARRSPALTNGRPTLTQRFLYAIGGDDGATQRDAVGLEDDERSLAAHASAPPG